MTVIFSCASKQVSESYDFSPRFRDGKFHNETSLVPTDIKTTSNIFWRYVSETRIDATPARPIPLEAMTKDQLVADNAKEAAVYRLGHSSLLLALTGEFWLIDPVFSERASPFKWLGPKRFHPTPIALDQLPKIRGVIISHDHYDHLDRETIMQLKDQVDYFVTPLGVGQHLRSWGVEPDRIHELDWWQDVSFGKVKLTATPAQHFSGRGLLDGNQTLWSSWVIRTGQASLFFSGDSGYFDGFKEIGERLGPFDLTMIENGAYDRNWSQVHMTPEETMQAHLDLRGRALMPVHNGTFDLALHPWLEPFERLSALAQENQIPLVTPVMGKRVPLTEVQQYHAWWRKNPEIKIVDNSTEVERGATYDEKTPSALVEVN